MATQYEVAFSSEIVGVGVIAGGPYYCTYSCLSFYHTNTINYSTETSSLSFAPLPLFPTNLQHQIVDEASRCQGKRD